MTAGTSLFGRGRWIPPVAIGLVVGVVAPVLATVNSEFDGQTLRITADGDGESIIVANGDANATVNGTAVAPANAIVHIEVIGSPGDDQISLVSVNAGDFPALVSVSIDGGGGADQIFGSQLDDTIIDDDGGDEWTDQGGNDTYIVDVSAGGVGQTMLLGLGLGEDTLSVEGSSGSDLFLVGSGQTSVGARSVVYTIDNLDLLSIRGLGGDDTFVVQPADAFPISIEGGTGRDHLVINNNGNTVTQTSASIEVSGAMPVNFTGIEDVSNCDLASLDPTDCDGNGVADACELASGVATDADDNGVIDACEQNVTGGDDNGSTTTGSTADNTTSDGTTTGTGGGSNGTTDGSGDTPGSSGSGASGGAASTGTGSETSGGVTGDNLSQTLCGAGLCGFGFVPSMPLMLAGLAGFKWRIRRSTR